MYNLYIKTDKHNYTPLMCGNDIAAISQERLDYYLKAYDASLLRIVKVS